MRPIRDEAIWRGSRVVPLRGPPGMTGGKNVRRRRYQNASTRDSMLCRFSVPGTVAGSANAVCGI